MDAISKINKYIDIYKLLEHYRFDNIRQHGKMIRACCKIHNGDNPTAFVADRETGLWYCHTDNCGGGDAYTLVQLMENISFSKAVQWLASFFSVDINNLEIIERKAEYLIELNEWMNLMKDKKREKLISFNIKEKIRPVTKFRNFKLETLQHFNLGYVDNVELKRKDGSSYKLFKRLVFPVVFKKMQVGIAFRRIKSSDMPKWSNQPVNLKYGDILYNYDNVHSAKEIIVCEGITDVWAFYEIGLPAVATFGDHITDEQYRLLLITGANIVLAFDGDKAGYSANQRGIELFKNKANINLITFPQGNDPESITREELIRLYEHKRKL